MLGGLAEFERELIRARTTAFISWVKAMTDEQIEGAIAAIEAWMAARMAGEGAKVIEGEAEVVPSLPAPGSGGTKMPKV